MSIETQIAAIEALPNEALKQRWRKHFRRAPPVGLPPKMMREAFIYACKRMLLAGYRQTRADVLIASPKKLTKTLM